MRISLIVAMSNNRAIGIEGRLPWRLSADLRRFKRLTMGHAIIMGRKTFESIGRVLPGRRSIVLSRQSNFAHEGVDVVGDLKGAIAQCQGETEVFIIGGAAVYETALPGADRLYVTQVDCHIDGDVYFPPFDESHWKVVEESEHMADDKNEYAYSFRVLDRKGDD